MSIKKYISSFLTGLACLMGQAGYGQDQKLADSLVKIYQKDTLRDKAQLQLLGDLSFNEVRNLGVGFTVRRRTHFSVACGRQ